MKLLTKSITEQLLRNGRVQAQRAEEGRAAADFLPVVKLFTPDANGTWLLTELDPEDPDIAFGLCDLGMGCPELGSVRISELESVRGAFGLPVERSRRAIRSARTRRPPGTLPPSRKTRRPSTLLRKEVRHEHPIL